MVSRLLNICGVHLGSHQQIYHADHTNEKGSWEHSELSMINRAVLSHIDQSSSSIQTAEPGWEFDSTLEPFYDHAREVIQREFRGAAVWGWKLPEASMTIPFWRRVTPDLKFVVCVRNPVDFAKSVAKYHGIGRNVSYNYWQYYNLIALRDTRPDERIINFYEDYFPDYQQALTKLLDYVGLSMPEPGSPQHAAILEFHSPGLKHHNTSFSDVMKTPSVPDYVKQLYQEMLDGPSDGSVLPSMQQASSLIPMLHQIIESETAYQQEISTEEHVAELEQALVEVSGQRTQLAQRSEQLEQILASRTHQIAARVCNLLIRYPVVDFLRHASKPTFAFRPAPTPPPQDPVKI